KWRRLDLGQLDVALVAVERQPQHLGVALTPRAAGRGRQGDEPDQRPAHLPAPAVNTAMKCVGTGVDSDCSLSPARCAAAIDLGRWWMRLEITMRPPGLS